MWNLLTRNALEAYFPTAIFYIFVLCLETFVYNKLARRAPKAIKHRRNLPLKSYFQKPTFYLDSCIGFKNLKNRIVVNKCIRKDIILLLTFSQHLKY